MATTDELRTFQSAHYYSLLSIKAQNHNNKVLGLDIEIARAKAAMSEPVIAWVEKQVAEAYPQQ